MIVSTLSRMVHSCTNTCWRQLRPMKPVLWRFDDRAAGWRRATAESVDLLNLVIAGPALDSLAVFFLQHFKPGDGVCSVSFLRLAFVSLDAFTSIASSWPHPAWKRL